MTVPYHPDWTSDPRSRAVVQELQTRLLQFQETHTHVGTIVLYAIGQFS